MPEFDFDEVMEEESIITPRRTPGEDFTGIFPYSDSTFISILLTGKYIRYI